MKKAQITIFIIIGIILLFSAAIVVYIQSSVEERKLEIKEPEIEDVPNYAQPVSNFIEQCIEQTAIDAFVELGNKGGYIYENNIKIIQDMPTSSNTLELLPNSDIKPAYWYYLKGDNDCTGYCEFASMRPPLYRGQNTEYISEEYAIETQIDKYIESNLKKCFRGFDDFKEFTVVADDNITTLTTITEEDVRILIYMETDIVKGNNRAKTDKFYKKISFDFKNIYEKAYNITQFESEYSFLESSTLDLLTIFSGIDELKIPPMSTTDFETSGVYWQEDKVKDNIQLMLQSFTPYFKIKDSLNYERVIVEENEFSSTAQGIYDSMVLPITGFSTLGVNFNYFSEWPIYFDTNSESGMIGPEGIYEPLLNFGIQRYETIYDISYPVLISIVDPYAFNNKGYTFWIALEANIRNNEAINETFEPIESFALPQGSMMCNIDKRNSGNITVKTTDKITQEPIPNLKISYSIGDESCFIGKTNNKGILETKFPVGINGIISFDNQDYLRESKFLTTRLGEEQNIEVELYPFKEIEISLMKKQLHPRWTFNKEAVELDPEESATIILTRIPEQGQQDHEVFASLKQEETKIDKFAPGEYDIEINVINDKEFKILPQERCIKMLGGLIKECYWAPEKEISVESYTSGGYSQNITITEDNIYNNEKVTFYAINPDVYSIPVESRVIEDMGEIGKIPKYSKIYGEELHPNFRR